MTLDTIQVTTLDNGLTIATDRMDGVKTATVGLWNKAGSRYESKTNNGVAHFLEHMLFKGTKTRDALRIAKEIENVGGYMNAYTSNEITAYYARVMQDDVALAVDITSDLLLNSLFPADELEKERGVIIQEIGMNLDDPQSLVGNNAQLTAYGDHPLGWNILGPAEIIASMPRQTMIDFMHDHYAPDNMVLVGSGAVEHAALVDQAHKIFGSMAKRKTTAPLPADYVGGDHRQQKDLEQTNLILGFEGVDYAHPDFYALSILAVILGDGMSSRLFQEIREKRGLVYSISSFVDSYSDSGLFGFHAGTGPELVAELIPVLCGELLKAAGSFTAEEINRAKAQFRAQNVMALESTFRRAEKLGHHIIKYGRQVPLEEVLQKIDAVDAKALDKLAQRIFTARPTFATVGPLGKVETFDQIEKRLAA
jgi:predicted Zn-dependent peptidase